jgi:hypothetical protein
MFLRAHLADGKTSDGQSIEIDQSGVALTVMLGTWGQPGGRQFSVNLVHDLAAAILRQIAKVE